MPHKLFENLEYNPTIYLFSDPDGLGLSLIEHLLTNFCKVTIVTSNVKLWKEKTHLLSNNNSFKIVSLEEPISNFDLSYSIFVDIYLNRNKKEVTKVLELNKNILGKKFVLFPYQTENLEEKKKLLETKSLFVNNNIDVEYFYIGDIIGPNINGSSYVYKIISLLKKGIVVKDPTNIYPILAKDIVKEISNCLFSFGPTTNEVSLIGKGISVENVRFYLTKSETFAVQQVDILTQKRLKVGNITEDYFPINLTYSLKDTINWLKDNDILPNLALKSYKKEFASKKSFSFSKRKIEVNFKRSLKLKHLKIRNKTFSSNAFFYGIYLTVVLFLLPLFSMLFSASSFALFFNSFEKGNTKTSVVFLNISKQTSIFSMNAMRFFSGIPVIGQLYNKPYQISSLINDGNSIAERGLKLYAVLDILPSKILGNDLYSVSVFSKDVYLEFDSLYKEISFLIGEIDSLDTSLKQMIYKYITKERVYSLKEKVLFLRNVSSNLDRILGSKEKRTYLVLFQNNMELRPTGGFIGSFAIITFEGGRMIEINVQDVYSADGQLKGYVDPPNPISQYLGEEAWYLRDANWDPDFPSSANKIEWFLEKEIGQKVDGIFAIDLELIKELIKVTGTIHLSDYNKDIDYKNIYEVTQFEAEENFFPGSRNKSNFLTALSSELINVLLKGENNNFKISRVFISGLEEKHLQLFFHDNNLQKEISNFNFSGGVVPKSCLGNCFYNFASYVDANVGVNKANYFIERSSSLDVFLSENTITNVLKINIKNKANPVLGDKVRYKSYIRALGLPGSNFENIKIKEYGQENSVVPEIEVQPNYKSAGSIISVMPSEEKTIEFVWTNEIINGINLYSKGEFGTYFRKQAGTVNDKIIINFLVPNYLKIKENNFFTLTGQGSYVYNTLLTRDVFPLIYW